jgi:hypothetical protein
MLLGIKSNLVDGLVNVASISVFDGITETVLATSGSIVPSGVIPLAVNTEFDKIRVVCDTLLTSVYNGFFDFVLVAKFNDSDTWHNINILSVWYDEAHFGKDLVVGSNDILNVVGILTTEQQTALNSKYSTEQLAVINTLGYLDKVVFATGTATQKNAIILTLTVEQQAIMTGVRAEFIQTPEQINADKLTLEQIVFKLKNGNFISDDDSVFYALGNSLMATAAMAEIDAGRGYDGLRNIGLTQVQALKVLSIYNVTLETSKYESEKALTALVTNPDNIVLLKTYLAGLTPPLELPSLTPYLSALRADHAVYTAIAGWTP